MKYMWIQTEYTREKAEKQKAKLDKSGKWFRLMIRKNSPKQASRGQGTFFRIWGIPYDEKDWSNKSYAYSNPD